MSVLSRVCLDLRNESDTIIRYRLSEEIIINTINAALSERDLNKNCIPCAISLYQLDVQLPILSITD